MAVELDHQFTTSRSLDDSFSVVTDLEKVVPCVEGASVLEATSEDSVKAQIKVKMGALSMTFTGTAALESKDPAAHTAAQITGKAASMGEGVVQSVLDALIKDFTGKLGTI